MTDGEFFNQQFPVWRAGWGRQFSGKENSMENISWWIIGFVGMVVGYLLGQQVRKSDYNELKERADGLQRIVDNKPIVYYEYTIDFSYRYDRGVTMVSMVTDYSTITMTLPYDITMVGTNYPPLLKHISNATRKGNPEIIRFKKHE